MSFSSCARPQRDRILQLQLAKAGVRLGGLLNSLLLDEALSAAQSK